MKIKKYSVQLLLFILLIMTSMISCKTTTEDKPDLLVLTDVGADPDDIQSLRRLLLYSHEFNIKGLIATSTGRSINEHLIHDAITDFEKVRDNLLLHAKGYPTADELRAVVSKGQVNRGAENLSPGLSTPGSQHIIDVVDATDQLLYITIWGGAHDLAQALLDIKSTRSSEEINEFISKIRVYAIGDQDLVFTSSSKGTGEWIRENFPNLIYIESGPPWRALQSASFRGMYQNDSRGGDHPSLPLVKPGLENLNNTAWVLENVTSWGPLGEGYPAEVNQNPGSERNTKGVKEGDTPSWFYVLRNGLSDPEYPEWGGWGGRFENREAGHYIDAEDDHWSGEDDASLRRKWAVARWREAFQNDFAARMRWCKLSYAEANHNPVAVVGKDTSREVIIKIVKQGETVTLDASASYDPDGDNLSVNWWIYHEASSSAEANISNNQESIATVEIPASASPGDVHIILEVTDDGTPALTAYRRVIIKVNNN